MGIQIAMAIISGIGALATATVASLVVFGNWPQRIARGPQLRLKLLDKPLGEVLVSAAPDGSGATVAIWYHLEVDNRWTWPPVKNCAVFLRGVERRTLNESQFKTVPFVTPRQLAWTPRESQPQTKTFSRSALVDFGHLPQERTNQHFSLNLYDPPFKINDLVVGKGDVVRYHLEVTSENETSPRQVFEVSWDGEWSSDLLAMMKHLIIREVPEGKAPAKVEREKVVVPSIVGKISGFFPLL